MHLLQRQSQSAQLRSAAIGFYFNALTLLARSICRPFRANRSGRRFPGLKPCTESSSPFGAKALRARHFVPGYCQPALRDKNHLHRRDSHYPSAYAFFRGFDDTFGFVFETS